MQRDRIEYKICEQSGVARLMEFMRAEWDKNHIMANSVDYLDYFFYDKKNERYNITYALDKETGEIGGFIAYVPASFYDSALVSENDFLWITNWLVSKTAGADGLALYAKMLKSMGIKSIGIVGLNETAEAIYRKMGYETGALTQYYMFRKAGEDKNLYVLSPVMVERLAVIEKCGSQTPKKTAAYIVNKYLKSPYYTYYAYGTEALQAAIIFRVQEYPGGEKRCIRIIDCLGDICALSAMDFNKLLREFDAEYADFYCAGVPEKVLLKAGFEKNEGRLLLPNYFEPFVNKNIEIRYAYVELQAEKKDGFTVFKGDGDRDFPRLY